MAGKKGGFTRGGFTRMKVGWTGVFWTMVVWTGVEEALGPTNWFWADFLWKRLKWWRSWESGGVEGEASLLKLCCKSAMSRSVWFKSPWDIVIKMFFVWCKPKCKSSKTTRFSRTYFFLKRLLSGVYFLDLEVCHKIFYGLSTIVGGLGSRWDLVLILCEARLLFKNEKGWSF